MYAEAYGEALDGERLLLLGCGLLELVVLLDGLLQLGEDMACAALVERRRDVGDDAGVGAALGHHALPHITYSVVVEVRQRGDERLPPVAGGEGDLLARGELEAAMRAEVHQGICGEGVACPEVGGHVGVRGRSACAVDDGKAILTEARHGLRKEDDLTVLNARDRQLGVPRALLRHVAAGGRAVLLLELG